MSTERTEDDVARRIREIEERRASRKAEFERQRQLQYLEDLEAFEKHELEQAPRPVVRTMLSRYVPGLPTFVVHRYPTRSERKRSIDRVAKGAPRGHASRHIEAMRELAGPTLLYPDRETYDQLCEVFTGLPEAVGNSLTAAVECRTAEEGKG